MVKPGKNVVGHLGEEGGETYTMKGPNFSESTYILGLLSFVLVFRQKREQFCNATNSMLSYRNHKEKF